MRHLRFVQSLLLTPIVFLALTDAPTIQWRPVLVLLLILALSIFPASNGYNSFYDRDEGSIGGLERPPPVDRQLFYYSLILEVLGLLLTWLAFDLESVLILTVYGAFSKLYSHPAVRLKARPWASLLVVALCQGPLIYLLASSLFTGLPWTAENYLLALASFLMIVAVYPLTQIYQHTEDERRGDFTVSRLLGIRGTFLFSGTLFSCLVLVLAAAWTLDLELAVFVILNLPVFVLFFKWARSAWSDPRYANYSLTTKFLKGLSTTAHLSLFTIYLMRTL